MPVTENGMVTKSAAGLFNSRTTKIVPRVSSADWEVVLKFTSDKAPETDPAPVPLDPSFIFFKIVRLELELMGIAEKFPIGVTGMTDVVMDTEIMSAEVTSWEGGQDAE